MCERCIEVFSRHNFSLRTIDLHDNSMSGRALRKVSTSCIAYCKKKHSFSLNIHFDLCSFDCPLITVYTNFLGIQQLLGHIETRQIPVQVLTGPLPLFDPMEKEEVIPIRSGGHTSMLSNWQRTQYPTVSLAKLAPFHFLELFCTDWFYVLSNQ